MTRLTKAVFLDRDGVINRKAPEGGYITRWEDFHILPGVAESIALLNQAGFRVIVITNQRCIAKGLLSIADLKKMHGQMSALFAKAGATIDAIYYCPHDYADECTCRKPAPGMLLEAAREHAIDMLASWMIGDSDIDVEAGKSAGCKTVRLLETNQSANDSGRGTTQNCAYITTASLLDAVRQVLHVERAAVGSFTAVR